MYVAVLLKNLSELLFSLLCHPVYHWICSSPCLLTRLSGLSDSWPENKSRIIPFLNGFEWKLVIIPSTTPREDTGEEPSWVYKKPHIWSGTRLCCVKVTCMLTNQIPVLSISQLSEQLMGQTGCLAPHGSCFLTSGLCGSITNMWKLLLDQKKTISECILEWPGNLYKKKVRLITLCSSC